MGNSDSRYVKKKQNLGFNIDLLPIDLKNEILFDFEYDKHPEKDFSKFILIPKNVTKVINSNLRTQFLRIPDNKRKTNLEYHKDTIGYGWTSPNVTLQRNICLEDYVDRYCYIKMFDYVDNKGVKKYFSIYVYKSV